MYRNLYANTLHLVVVVGLCLSASCSGGMGALEPAGMPPVEDAGESKMSSGLIPKEIEELTEIRINVQNKPPIRRLKIKSVDPQFIVQR